jgi:small subunit ribosomal protein S19e
MAVDCRSIASSSLHPCYVMLILVVVLVVVPLCSCEASIARRVYLRGGVGVGEFSRIYGGLKSNGARRPHYATAARGVIRHALQQLEELDLLAKRKEKKGRYLTRNGQRELDTIAAQVAAARKA